MATHSSIPAWRILWTEEPGGLQFMGLQRVGQDWATNTFTYVFTFKGRQTAMVVVKMVTMKNVWKGGL